MADKKANLDIVRALADLAIDKDLSEIEYETAKERIHVVRHGSAVVTNAVAPVAAPPTAVAPSAAAAIAAEVDDSASYIESPMVGTFYVAPAPDAPPFIETGDKVKSGQVVCIVEAMKLMNEIESEVDGIVAETLVDNGQGVEFGQKLYKIMPA